MGAVIYIFILSAVASCTSYPMICYQCHSNQIDGCLKNKNLTYRDCGSPLSSTQWYCFYSVSYDTVTHTTTVLSDCVSVPKEECNKRVFSICESQKVNVIIRECRVCESYLCNSATLLNISRTTLAYVLFAYLITKPLFH